MKQIYYFLEQTTSYLETTDFDACLTFALILLSLFNLITFVARWLDTLTFYQFAHLVHDNNFLTLIPD